MEMSCMIVPKHNYIVLGGSGSGKTELALNLAEALAGEAAGKVTFFDMDQTKTMFRARDFRDMLSAGGVSFRDTPGFMDSPVVPHGVTTALEDEDAVCVFDVGGNATGARMIGQFGRYLTPENTVVLYLINPYRVFADTSGQTRRTMREILNASSIQEDLVRIVSNPAYGAKTSSKDIIEGHRQLKRQLDAMGLSVFALTVPAPLAEEVDGRVECTVFPLHLHIKYY